MNIPPVALKRKNHRLLLCTDAKKKDLLAKLIFENEGKRIAVAVYDDTEKVYIPEGVTLLMDGDPCEATFDLLINYDLPADPAFYFARLALTEETALTLMGESDQPHLLAIETLLGRAISQERPEGYAPELPAQPKPKPKRRAPEKNERTFREKRPEKAPFEKEPRPAPKRKPKASGVSRYIGKDENGKPMFSGKSGERNHRHDGKPHTEESLAAKREWEAKRKKNGPKKPVSKENNFPSKGTKKYDSASTDAPKPKRPVRRIKAEALKKSEPKE